jgi:hypothetical protein
LIPGALCLNKRLEIDEIHYLEYGLPLKIFHSNYILMMYFTINDLDFFDQKIDYFIGTTNMMV